MRSATEPGRLLRVGVLRAVEQAGASGATERESPTRFLTRYQIGRNACSNLSGNKLWRQTEEEVPEKLAGIKSNYDRDNPWSVLR